MPPFRITYQQVISAAAHVQREFTQFSGYPSLAQIAGHAMSSIFLDGLSSDIERLKRINDTLSLLTPEQRAQFKKYAQSQGHGADWKDYNI